MHGDRRYDVLGLGALAVDDLLYVDAYPAAERKVRVRHRERQCGGLTGTALVAAARFGARCGYAGVLGDDALSRYVIDRLEHEGVDVSCRVHRDDARPAHSTIIIDRTHHTRTVFASVEGAIGADPVLPEAKLIRSASVLLVDHHGSEGSLRAARIARAGGVPVVADFERTAEPPFDALLAEVGHLVVGEAFARTATGLDAGSLATVAEALAGPLHESVVVTCGENGCWYLASGDGTAPRHLPAFPVRVCDPTGCGDVFHGVYAAALADGADLPQRVALASAAAAIKATHRGGQSGIPTRADVERFLAQRG